jgi:AraC-like DNA-binding protein
MKRNLKVFFITVVSLMAILENTVSGQDKKKIDSLYNVVKAMKGQAKLEAYDCLVNQVYDLSDTNFKVSIIKEYIKEAKKQNNFEKECNARMLLMDFYRTYNHKLFYEHCDDFLSFASKHKFYKKYFYVYSAKALLLIQERKYNESHQAIEQMYAHAKKYHNEDGLGQAAYTFARFYLETDRPKHAIPYLEEAIRHFKNSNSVKDEYVSIFGLVDAHLECGMHEEALKIMPNLEKIQKERDQEFNFFEKNGHYHIDKRYVKIYLALDEYGKARIYIKKIDEYINDLSPFFINNYRGIMSDYYEAIGNYNKALELIDSVYNYNLSVGNQYFAIRNIYYKGLLLAKMGRGEEAEKVLEHYRMTKDSIDKINADAKLDELRTQYDVDRISYENQRKTYIIIGILVLVVLSLASVVIFIVHYRRLLRSRRRYLVDIIRNEQVKIENSPCAASNNDSICLESKEENLFNRLNEYLLRTNAFTQSVNCSELARKLNTNEKYLYSAIKGAVEMTFMEYINSLRLEHAKKLLSEQSNATVESVAFDCGFQSRSTLYKLFKIQYGVSPAEWRKKR